MPQSAAAPEHFTVADLVEMLRAYPATARVVLAGDAEGNAFRALRGHEPCTVASERFGRVDIGHASRVATAPAVILWPY